MPLNEFASRLTPLLNPCRTRWVTPFAFSFFALFSHAQEAPTEPASETAATAVTTPALTSVTTAPKKKTLKRRLGGVAPYTQPLRFAPEDNGLSIQNPQARWDFKSPTNVNINGLKLDANTIQLNVTQIRRKSASDDFQDSAKPYLVTSVSFQWPEILTHTGKISIESPDGKILWSQEMNAEDEKEWIRVSKKYGKTPMVKGHESAMWGLYDVDPQSFSFLWKNHRIRACLNQAGAHEAHLRVCSRYYDINVTREVSTLIPVAGAESQNVFLNDKALGNAGILNFQYGQPLRLKFVFADASLVEIASLPADMQLLDVVVNSEGTEIVLTGHGEKPLGKVQILSKPVTHFWSPTGISQERIWQVAIPRDLPTLRVLGEFNFPFTMLLDFERIPKESERVYIRSTRSSGTYSSSPTVYGYAPGDVKVGSKENSARNTSSRFFEWKFAAPKKGQENRAKLLVKGKEDSRTWVAHHRMYRSYPFEASGRLTGIASADGSVFLLGEVSAAAYFESLGFTQNAIFSKQRWGLAGRYFRALTSIESKSGVRVSEFSATNLDAKYNLLPGLWQYDEVFGAILSLQKVDIVGLSHTAGGVGAYWARTMPKVFDDLFNYFPYMKHKKYVDMELVYYPFSLTAGYNAGSTFNLNFHGRVFWTERFYGEAGFGIRRYEFTIPERKVVMALSALYGTMGLGIVF